MSPSPRPVRTLVYSPRYRTFSYGPHHPLRPARLHLTHTLMKAYGLLEGASVRVLEPEEASCEDAWRVHSREYMRALFRANDGQFFHGALDYGLGFGDNPIFAGIYEWSMLACGGSLMATREVAEGRSAVAFHTGGGFHHAHRAKAGGFCYVNDIAVALAEQAARGRRILYLDLDAHHGDGVQEAFYDSDRVLTISIHESGHHLFPGTGFPEELGEGKGRGYSVNVPLQPGSADPVFVEAFEAVIPPLIKSFAPDLVALQLGVDTMKGDPLAHLMVTTDGFVRVLTRIRELFTGGIVAFGGGGYEMDTVARAWTLAWATLCGKKPPNPLPEAYVKERAIYGLVNKSQMTLRDPTPDPVPDQVLQHQHLHQTLHFLKKEGVIP